MGPIMAHEYGRKAKALLRDVGIRGVALDEDDVLTVLDQVIDHREGHHRFADTSFAPTDPIDSRSVSFDAESLIHGSFLRV
jgi:hypothetical protein